MNKKAIATLTLSVLIAGLVVSATNADFEERNFSFNNMEVSQDFQKGYK